ncbi:methionyl-tRNA formyltransferase [Pelagibius litoralis]|uniref:Methionyl-tRNA formyltransferase n=1 Tax=Pelagibius litoralis TaxID=374515 RepID=A0A967F1M1_9PROT|nr:methionyl-tRNA formyltransferase [Pelagibius litoralis]NIA71290.1 methionyl-tRNA formyltransferase [Pelagibius litoralis]
MASSTGAPTTGDSAYPLRLAFMGTPDFAVPALQALADAGHEIVAVYTQPPRPAGRGQKARPSPVQALAERAGWPVRTPKSLKTAEERQAFAGLALDAAVVAAYGLILPAAILAAPRLGCLNVHASLLPRWRGAAPIQRAILAGDRSSGITIMQMDEGLDTGAVLLQESLPIEPDTNAQQLHDALADLGGRLIVEGLEGSNSGRLLPQPQPELGVTYAAKLEKGEGRLDWAESAAELDRRVRAFTPWPGAFFEVAQGDKSERIKVLAAEPLPQGGMPGEILDQAPTVACGAGSLRLQRLQRAGRAAMTAEEFLRGFALATGSRLPSGRAPS